MILLSFLALFTLSCVLFWHKMRIDTQTSVHEQNMMLLEQRFTKGNQNNIKTVEQVKLSEEILRSVRETNTVIGRDIYLVFRDMLGQITNKTELE